MRWIWPRITSEETAKSAARQGSIAAALVALYGAATFFLLPANPNIVDCILFAIVSWRVGKMSRAWAVIGLFLYLMEVGFAFAKIPPALIIGLVLFVIPFANAVRGTFIFAQRRVNTSLPL